MIDASFVQEIRDTAPVPTVETVGGRQYLLVPQTTKNEIAKTEVLQWMKADMPIPEELPTPLVVRTLSALAAYIASNIDVLVQHAGPEPDAPITGGGVLVHVQSPTVVMVYSPLTQQFAQRAIYIKAELPKEFGGFPFGQFLAKEEFGIHLQTCFQQTGLRDLLWALCAGMKDGAVREFIDDGVKQEITVKAGVTMGGTIGGNQVVPNPVRLKPFRTFRDISEQVESEFILRAQGGSETSPPKLALFESDGGAWQLEAIEKCAAFLREKLPTWATVIS